MIDKRKIIIFPLFSLEYHGGVRDLIHWINALCERVDFQPVVLVPQNRFSPAISLHQRAEVKFLPKLHKRNPLSLLKTIHNLTKSGRYANLIVSNFFLTFYASYPHFKKPWLKHIYFIQDDERFFVPKIFSFIPRYTYKKRDNINYVFLSNFLKNRLNLPGEVINPPVTDFFPDKDLSLLQLKKNKLSILYLWRNERRKGGEIFLKVLENLLYHPRLQFWIVNPSRLIVKKYGNTKKVIFFPFQNISGLRKLYSSADIFLHTSWIEGFGLPPLENMFCKNALAVLTDSGGIRDYAIDGFNSIIVPHDPYVISKKILEVMDQEDYRNQLIHNAYKTAQDFTPQKIYPKIVDFIAKTLNLA